jgi:hypothetical protein
MKHFAQPILAVGTAHSNRTPTCAHNLAASFSICMEKERAESATAAPDKPICAGLARPIP